MNEILPEGYSGETWVELYNCNPDSAVDLGGWFLTNDPLDSCKFPIPPDYKVESHAFAILPLPFLIARSFGFLQLWKPDSTFAYGITFDGVHIGESVGFCDLWITCQEPSPGLPNTCLSFTDVVETALPAEKEEISFYDFLGREISPPLPGIFICVRKKGKDRIVQKIIQLP